MQLFDLMDSTLFEDMMEQGYVVARPHEHLPLMVLNYTTSTQLEQKWNEVTTQCRGLIVDNDGLVVARAYDKFLNYGHNQADVLLLDGYEAEVTDKVDGSLGVFWQYQGYQGIATRGSFESEMAQHATELWNRKYRPAMGSISTNWTYLFEIIYPENRIVLDYGEFDDLVLLGARNIETGATLPATDVSEWQWNKTTTFPYKSLREAIEAPDRPNAEGFVVYFPELDYRIKVKQEDYVKLHKLVFGLSAIRVWKNMQDGMSFEEMAEVTPDEWHGWLKETYNTILDKFSSQYQRVKGDYEMALLLMEDEYGDDWGHKEFAHLVAGLPNWGLLFTLLNNKPIDSEIWKMVRPKNNVV